jgi:Protein of unknown function (DUF3108)
MDTCRVEFRQVIAAPIRGALRGGGALMLSLGLALLPLPANSGETSADRTARIWPTSVQAHYRLYFAGIDVGRLDINANTAGNSYSLSGSGKISLLLGTIAWSASSRVSGVIDGDMPAPTNYAFDWRQNKKRGFIHIGFKDRVATEVAVKPPTRVKPDTVPLAPAHRTGALDPMSAVLMLTKADSRPPCDRRVRIFDGKQRYDLVLTPKRLTRLPSASGRGHTETAYVCRAMYEPVAGHRDNADTKAYAAKRDVEVVLRRIPGSDMLIPYSVTVPTEWGTGSMVTDRIDVVTAAAGKIAFTN